MLSEAQQMVPYMAAGQCSKGVCVAKNNCRVRAAETSLLRLKSPWRFPSKRVVPSSTTEAPSSPKIPPVDQNVTVEFVFTKNTFGLHNLAPQLPQDGLLFRASGGDLGQIEDAESISALVCAHLSAPFHLWPSCSSSVYIKIYLHLALAFYTV